MSLRLPRFVTLALCLWCFGGLTASLCAQEGETIPAIQLLRDYCRSCHAIQPYRFIISEDDAAVAAYIKTATTVEGETWLRAIRRTITWPTPEPPAMDEMMENGKNWMPMGTRRIDIAYDQIMGESARIYLLNALDDLL